MAARAAVFSSQGSSIRLWTRLAFVATAASFREGRCLKTSWKVVRGIARPCETAVRTRTVLRPGGCEAEAGR